MNDSIKDYLKIVRETVDAIEADQLESIKIAALKFAKTILEERLVHVFGTGHSRMAVEEMFPRYGSFPGFHPIVELSMTYHNQVVARTVSGRRCSWKTSPVSVRCFGETSRPTRDCLLAISTGGCGAVTIDVAIEAKTRGMFVVALTSLAHSGVSESRHESGRKLHEVADLVLDQHAPAGDAIVRIDGLEARSRRSRRSVRA